MHKFGEVLKNGAIVVKSHLIEGGGLEPVYIVLARGHIDFATWLVTAEGSCHYGNYFGDDINGAAENYKMRGGK